MRIFRPEGLLCEKCGRPLAFKQLANGKWCPCDPDGADHWDECKAIQRRAMGILNEDGSVNWAALRKYDPPRIIPSTDSAYFWCGPVAPWDESLGPFRLFTAAEIEAGEVCRP